MRRIVILAAAATAAALPLAPASAQFRNVGPGVADRTATISRGGGGDWVFGGEVQTSLELDVNGTQRPRNAYGNLFTDSLVAAYLLMPYGFVLNGVIRLDQTDQEADGRGAVFRNQAAYIDELNLTWSEGSLDIFGGKIHPRFGSAWDRGPGLYGTDFGSEYELTQKLGVGARLWLSDLFGLSGTIGSHNLQAEFFTADRSALSTSLLSPQWAQQLTTTDPATGQTVAAGTAWRFRNRRWSGTPDNTSFLGGTVVSLAGSGIPMPRGDAGYTLSYSNRRPGEDAELAGRAAAETGWTAGAFWTLPLPLRVVAAPFVEYAAQRNAGGYRSDTQDWLIAGFDLRRSSWTFSYAFQQNHSRDGETGDAATRVEHAASVTYDFGLDAPTPLLRPLSVTFGYRRLREAGTVTDGVGGLVAWSWKF